MSIALPFNRISVSASGHAGRVARSSSWLNKPREVRRDVQALFQVLEGSRSGDNAAVATSDAYSQAGSPHASTSTSLPASLNDRSRTSAAWKGKGRALPADEDLSATRTSARDYVEEGLITRPISTFFDTNAQSATTRLLSPTASTSKATTAVKKKQKRARLSTREIQKQVAVKAFRAHYELPETPSAARTLVNYLASNTQPLARMNILLDLLPECPPQVEIAALVDCLTFPLMPHADWNKHVLDNARSEVYNKGYTGPRMVIDDVTFYKVWMRLCDLAGDNLTLSPEVAVRTLKLILTLPSPKKMMRKPDAYRIGKPLRQLLFLAGLEDNPTLAVNVLAQAIYPNIFCAKHLLAAAQLDPEQIKKLQVPEATSEVNDIVLILQDLLRSGILSPSIVNRFGLSDTISKAPTMATTDFEILLRQTLLRIILQYYVDHGEQRYTASVAQALEPIAAAGSTEARSMQERDTLLLIESAKTSLRHLRFDLRQANATAQVLTRTVETIPQSIIESSSAVTFIDMRRVLRNFFKIVLEPDVEEVKDEAIGNDLAHLWSAIDRKGLIYAGEDHLLSVSQTARLLKMISHKAEAGSRPLLLDTARELIERVQQEINAGQKLNNDTANAIVDGVVHACTPKPSNQTENNQLVSKIYHLLLRPNIVQSGFSLQSQTLRPLVQYARKYPSSIAGQEAEEETKISGSAIIDHFMRTRGSWKVVPHADYTALAGALLDNEEPIAARQVLKQIFDAKEVPSLEDVEICLKMLARRHPEEARRIIEKAQEEGLRVAPDIS